MKKLYAIVLICAFINPSLALAESDDQILLKVFHKYGITKCDSFILKKSKLKSNWNFFISKQSNGIDGSATEVSIIEIFGSKNDTVKVDYSFIQTPKNCFLHERSTVTFSGSCDSNVDKDHWYISSNMPNKDYTMYKNNGGVEKFAKEITVGNFKACIVEDTLRYKGKQG